MKNGQATVASPVATGAHIFDMTIVPAPCPRCLGVGYYLDVTYRYSPLWGSFWKSEVKTRCPECKGVGIAHWQFDIANWLNDGLLAEAKEAS